MSSVAFSPDGHRIVSGSCDNTVRVWDADTGQPVGQPLTGHTRLGVQRGVQPRRQAHRLRQLATSTVRVWDADTGQPVGQPLTGHTDSVSSVAFSPDGHAHRLRQLRQDGAGVGRRHRPTDRPAADRPHRRGVRAWRLAPTGERIVSGSDDKTVRVWDAATGQPIGAPLTGHTGDGVRAWRSAPTAQRIVSGS